MNVVLFPGQGSQEVGMGSDLFKSDPSFRHLIAIASESVGVDLEPICRRGPDQTLARTRYLQPLLVAVSLGYLRHLTHHGVHPDLILGHSLGEITALAAAGIVSPETSVRIAAQRGALMDEAASRLHGGMLAVSIQLPTPLHHWLQTQGPQAGVVLANDNAPSQWVLSGPLPGLHACAEFIAREKLGRCRLLPVSGPWHSPAMADAAVLFDAWMQTQPLVAPQIEVLWNVSASPSRDPDHIRHRVSSALARPVCWRECMARVCALRPSAVFEVGPGRVLSGLARANGLPDPTRLLNINNLQGIARVPT